LDAPLEKNPPLLIGELASQFGVNRETLRYYERLGLLKPRRRKGSGYRIYDAEAADRLRFIRRAQAYGFSLEQIRELLDLRPESPRSCSRVFAMLDQKLEELAEHISETSRFHKQLSRYRSRCQDAMGRGETCPVILEVSQSSKRET
jgi:DNA-binding transcriptional MerR regulator